MASDIRAVTPEEMRTWQRAVAFGFHQPELSEEEAVRWEATNEIDRTVAVFERGEIVATAGAYTFDMTFPGPVPVSVAGVTAVTVRSTHRRQGLLTRMMRHQLDDVRARGECVAALTASESLIYGRFGYGKASVTSSFRIDTGRSEFERPVVDKGRLRLVDADAAAKVLPDLHDASRRRTIGDISRSQGWWDTWFSDPKDERGGATARFHLVHESAKGRADGYATYRLKGNWEEGLPQSELWVGDVVADDPSVYAALWRSMLDVDLVRTVVAWSRPTDDPVQWLVADPRQVRTTKSTDMLWVRLVDVAHALAARRYSGSGELVIDVADGFCPWNEGRYLLAVDDDGSATCTPTKKKADIRTTATELGAAFLGHPCFVAMARAGRVEELRAGAVERADALFRTPVTPYSRTGF